MQKQHVRFHYLFKMLDDAIRDLASELNRLLVEHHTQRSSNATFMSYENTVVLNVGSRLVYSSIAEENILSATLIMVVSREEYT